MCTLQKKRCRYSAPTAGGVVMGTTTGSVAVGPKGRACRRNRLVNIEMQPSCHRLRAHRSGARIQGIQDVFYYIYQNVINAHCGHWLTLHALAAGQCGNQRSGGLTSGRAIADWGAPSRGTKLGTGPRMTRRELGSALRRRVTKKLPTP
jgi:hypothetical protein